MYNIFHCSCPLSRVYSYRIIAEAEYVAEYININWAEAWKLDYSIYILKHLHYCKRVCVCVLCTVPLVTTCV